MSTLADLRGRLRIVLEDAAAAGYLWADGELNRHIADGVDGYSAVFPRECDVDVATVAGQAAYALPAGCERVVRVVWVEDGERELVEGGDAYGEGWEQWGGELVLAPAPSAVWTARVRYLGLHAALVNDGDVSSVPAGDEELVIVGAAARALDALGAASARAGEARAGTVAAAAVALWARWGQGVSVRLKRGGTRKLVRR